MIKLLRRRFVFTAMIAITALLIAVVGVINITNLVSVNRQVEQILVQLSDSRGQFEPQVEHRKRNESDFFPRPSPDDVMGARFFLVRTDPAGEIIHVNTYRIFAVTPEEATELARAALASGNRAGTLKQFRYRAVQLPEGGEQLIFLDVEAISIRSSTILWVSLAAAAAGWVIMLLLVMILSRQAIVPIARNMEKQKQFVTNAGHEIKTPLAIIMANTDALELHQGESKWTHNIRAQTDRLNGLMQNLLTLAKMDETGADLPSADFPADLLLEELIQPYLAMAEEKAVSAAWSIQPGVTIHGHRESITQLFSILLDNAVKYTPAGGKIAISLQEQGSKRVFQVSNTADLPPEQDTEKWFDRFYRGDSARTQKSGGYGIGLSAAKTIVDAHKGTIRAKYEGGQMVFTVTL